MAKKLKVLVGQVWNVGKKRYVIDSVNGPDGCYPIVMREVWRDPSIDAEIKERATHQPGDTAKREYVEFFTKPSVMNQELRWFELRTDVVSLHTEAP